MITQSRPPDHQRYLIIILVTGLLSFAFPALAQKQDIPVIEIDSLTMTLKAQIPYDKAFILKIKSDSKPPYVDFMQNKGNRSWNNTINYRLNVRGFFRLGRPASFEFNSIPEEQISFQKENNDSYVYIKFDWLPYKLDSKGKKNNFLKPGKNYTVVIPKLYDSGYSVFRYYNKGDVAKGESLRKDIEDQQQQNLGLSYLIPTVAESHKFFDDNLKTPFAALDGFDASFTTNTNTVADLNTMQGSALLKTLIDRLTTRDRSLVLPAKFADTLRLLNDLRTLFQMDLAHTPVQLLGGRCSADDTTTTDASADYDGRLKRLNTSLAAFTQIKDYADFLVIKGLIADAANERQTISRIMALLTVQVQLLMAEKKKEKEIRTAIVKAGYFLEPTIITGSSNIFDFKTRSKLQITPDFGYVVYGFQKGFTSFTPYLGFQINFRTLDKNIPWGVYPNKTLWHRLSFMTGWTLAGVAKQGKRENFFTSSSLLTGLGFKLTNAIKLTGGAMWFYGDDPNPLIDNRRLRMTPYAGLSVDLDVKEFLNDFTSLIPNLK